MFLRLSALGCGPQTAERDQRGENPSNAHPSFTSACVRVSFGSTNSVSGGGESPSDLYEPPQLVNCGLASLAPQSANCGSSSLAPRLENSIVAPLAALQLAYSAGGGGAGSRGGGGRWWWWWSVTTPQNWLPRICGSIYCMSSVKRTKASGVNGGHNVLCYTVYENKTNSTS